MADVSLFVRFIQMALFREYPETFNNNKPEAPLSIPFLHKFLFSTEKKLRTALTAHIHSIKTLPKIKTKIPIFLSFDFSINLLL